MDMFYSPCLAALYGLGFGDTTPEFFMAYKYYDHEECTKYSCLANDMRWDRNAGGCVASLLVGSTSPGYSGEDYCSKSNVEDDNSCKFKTVDLSAYHTKVTGCWSNTLPSSNDVHYYVENFCAPKLTSNEVDTGRENELKGKFTTHCSTTTSTTRRSLREVR